jgi:hypothetical protein
MKNLLYATLAATAVMFALAGLYTGVLAHEFIVNNVDPTLLRNPPNLILVACGYFLLALLMALLYPRLGRLNDSPAISGLYFGLAAGVCWLMPYSLVLFGVYKFPYVALPLDFAWALVEQGIGGLVIGLIYGKSINNA